MFSGLFGPIILPTGEKAHDSILDYVTGISIDLTRGRLNLLQKADILNTIYEPTV
jgi:hypothetical protein